MSSEILSAKDAGEIFEEVAELLEFQGENQFRVRAYETAARLLVSQTMSIPELMEEVKGGRIKGIGTGLQEALREISESGSYSLLSELRLSFPDGLRQLMRVSGLGPKKLKVLHEQLGISNLDAFLEACADGRLLEVKGFSEKTVAKLADAARRVADSQGHLLLSQATEETTRLAEALQEKAGLRVVCCGERRGALFEGSREELREKREVGELLSLLQVRTKELLCPRLNRIRVSICRRDHERRRLRPRSHLLRRHMPLQRCEMASQPPARRSLFRGPPRARKRSRSMEDLTR